MRIAVLCTDLGVRIPDESKGAAIHLLAVANALERAGNDTLLIGVAGHGPAPQDLETLLFPHPGRSAGLERERRKLAFVDFVVERAAARLETFRPDAIYERLALFGIAGQTLANELDVPHVVEANALIAREEAAWRGLRLRSLAHARERRVLERADLCIAVSDELRTQIVASAPGARVAVVPNGVDTNRFECLPDRDRARRSLGLPRASRVIAFVGSLRPWHGLEVGIRALTHLPEDVLLVVAGDGPERARLTGVADDAGVAGRVCWLGQRPHDEIPTVLAAADAAIAPYPATVSFAFSPLKIFEYLAAGVPIVATDIGQVRTALAHGRHGTLVAAGDVAALARGVRGALTPEARAAALDGRRHALRDHGWDARAATITSELEHVRARREKRALAR